MVIRTSILSPILFWAALKSAKAQGLRRFVIPAVIFFVGFAASLLSADGVTVYC